MISMPLVHVHKKIIYAFFIDVIYFFWALAASYVSKVSKCKKVGSVQHIMSSVAILARIIQLAAKKTRAIES